MRGHGRCLPCRHLAQMLDELAPLQQTGLRPSAHSPSPLSVGCDVQRVVRDDGRSTQDIQRGDSWHLGFS